jgi:predicted transcriptional regulator
MADTGFEDGWTDERTTFQRVYDVILGTQSWLPAQEIAEQCACSETGARDALEQLVEMGIARRQEGRPATYRRNDAYLTWKRVERLAHEYRPAELRERIDALIEEDDALRERFGVPDPDVVTSGDLLTEDHDAIHEHWEAVGEWRTVRRDLRVLRRALDRAEASSGDGARA